MTDGSLFLFPEPIGDLAEMTTDILIPRFRRGFLLSGSILQAFRAGHSTAGGYDTSPVSLDVSLRGAKRRGNLAVPGRIVGKLSAKTQLPSRDCHVGLWPPRNDKSESFTPQNAYRKSCQSAWRSASAATDAIGAYRFHGGLYGSGVRSRARLSPPLQRITGSYGKNSTFHSQFSPSGGRLSPNRYLQ